jgi:translin
LDHLHEISGRLIDILTAKSQVRDQALLRSRRLIRYCADTIRAVHREEEENALELLGSARAAAQELKEGVCDYPDLYYAGYTQDAMKEFVEASATYAIVYRQQLPTPEELGVEAAAYFCGLGEAASEMRRRVLDVIRRDRLEEGEYSLNAMEEIYGVLVTVDFPSALTGGLRRITDMVRGVLERTRGDLTMAIRQSAMQKALAEFEGRLQLNSSEE